MRRFILVVVLVCFVHVRAKKGIFPKELERCNRDDPALDECLKNAIQKALPVLANGLPKVGIIPIDPLHTPYVNMQQYLGPVTLNITFKDVYTRGYVNTTIQSVRAKIPTHDLRISAYFPRLIVDGTYAVTANVFLLPIQGSGKFSITLEQVDANLDIKGEGQLRGGDEYMNVKKTLLNFQPKKLIFDLRNLFNGDEKLGKQANWFINRHSLQIFEAVKPLAEDTVSQIIKGAAEPFYKKVPYPEIYL